MRVRQQKKRIQETQLRLWFSSPREGFYTLQGVSYITTRNVVARKSKKPSLQTPCIYGLGMDWYDGVHLKDRAFTAHERDSLELHARVLSVKTTNGEMMGVKGTVVKRPMDLKLTHYHHMNALVALLSCRTDPSCESIICYPGREIRSGNPKWHWRPHVYQLYLHRHSCEIHCEIHAEGTADVKYNGLPLWEDKTKKTIGITLTVTLCIHRQRGVSGFKNRILWTIWCVTVTFCATE